MKGFLDVHMEEASKIHENPEKTSEQVLKMFHTMAMENGLVTTYNMFNTRVFRESLTIPTAIWLELEPSIKEKISEARERVKEKRGYNKPNDKGQASYSKPIEKSQGTRPKSPTPEKIPNQYPNVKPKNTLANLVNSLGNIELNDKDSEDTDEDMLEFSTYMVRRTLPVDSPSDIIDIKARLNI